MIHLTGPQANHFFWSTIKDGRRLNVVDHGSLEVIRTDARACADFLQVPLWDAISFP